MTIRVVYASTSAMVDGFYIRFGETWYADDPMVKANPSLFTDDPRTAGIRTTAPLPEADQLGRPDAPVEQATAAPGERRSAVKRG